MVSTPAIPCHEDKSQKINQETSKDEMEMGMFNPNGDGDNSNNKSVKIHIL